MKRLTSFLLMMSFFSILLGTADATVVTYSFDPNDWITSYSTDISKTRLQQDNPRLLIDGVAQVTDNPGSTGTHTTYAGASYSSTGIAGYQSQVQNVVIHDFNMWVADGINAPNWGEVLTQVVGSIPSGTAANGWVAEVINNPWPQSGVGSKIVQWYDAGYWDGNPNTPAAPLTFGPGGTDFAPFTFTIDANPTDVHGNLVDFTAPQRIWLGTMLPVTWTENPNDLVYAGNLRFEGTMEMTPVPEPATMILLGAGLAGLAGLRKKFKKG